MDAGPSADSTLRRGTTSITGQMPPLSQNQPFLAVDVLSDQFDQQMPLEMR